MIPTIPGREAILEAAIRIRPYIHRTPVLTCAAVNLKTDAELYFKCENFQKTGAFKARGATNAVLSLEKHELSNGIITHSSGNHAAALALAASYRHTPAYIIMPSNSSKVKIEAVKSYGGQITFCEPTLEAREETLKRVQARTAAIEIHPYNDYRIIAGQASAALELIEEYPGLDLIMAPVGGGGLLSGTALSVHYFAAGKKVIAAEPAEADDAYRSFYQHNFIPALNPQTIADGLRTSLGTLTFPIIREFVSEIITVDENGIVDAMRLIWERMKIIVEPSSAVPLAALLAHPDIFRGKKTGIILSGGNVDLSNLPW